MKNSFIPERLKSYENKNVSRLKSVKTILNSHLSLLTSYSKFTVSKLIDCKKIILTKKIAISGLYKYKSIINYKSYKNYCMTHGAWKYRNNLILPGVTQWIESI